MHPSLGLWDRLFGKKVRIESPSGHSRWVSQRWLKEMVRQGHAKELPAIRVHSIGQPPELTGDGFDMRQQFDEWMMSGGKTYRVEYWEIGVQVSQEIVDQWRDPVTGDLFIYNELVNDKWGYRPCTREVFEKFRAIEDS
jgi:hypothetical protein